MENNKLCTWILHYSGKDSNTINSESIIDVESSTSIKLKLCSSVCYFESGQILFDNFPDISTGFIGILDYLCNHKGNVMDSLEDEQLRLYINNLKNSDNFSMRHHVSIIKCFMKIYVCQLVPCERINEALETINVAGIVEIGATYRHVQRCLSMWLREAAIIGIMKLSNSTKSVTRKQAISIVDNSTVGSLVLYAAMSYFETNLIKYTVKIPDTDSPVNGNTSDLSVEHSKIVLTMFLDLCGDRDLLPLDIDGLISRSMESVPVTLTVALLFHWIIGNSLRKSGNNLPTTKSNVKSDRSPSHKTSNLSFNNNANDTSESRSFFITDNRPPNDSLRQLFANGKQDERCRVNHCKSSFDGDTSSEVCLTPTDEEFPLMNQISPQIKPIPLKLFEIIPRPSGGNVMVEPVSFSLKEEFQKKLRVKQGLTKVTPRVNLVPGTETTWLEQSNKSEIINMPLTPKKFMKSSDVLANNGSNLSKSQLNQIQLQLSLRRQKMENEKKNVFEELEKSIETSKQKAFFQALDREKKVIRRRSLIVDNDGRKSDKSDADKRLSMYIKRTSENVVMSPIRRLGSREILHSLSDASSKNALLCSSAQDDDNDNNAMEPPQSSQISDTTLPSVHLCLDVTNEVDRDIEVVDILTKNNSASISSLSSFSNQSLSRNVITKEDYEKSIEKLNISVSSLQEQVRLLTNQRSITTMAIGCCVDEEDCRGKNTQVVSEENNSNNGLSLTDVTDLPKVVREIDRGFGDDTGGVSSKKSDCNLEPVLSVQSTSSLATPLHLNDAEPVVDLSQEYYEHNGGEDNLSNYGLSVELVNEPVNEDGARCSNDLVNQDLVKAPPISFMVLQEEENCFDASGKKAELLAKNEERRLLKMEQFKQKREHDRENKITIISEDLLDSNGDDVVVRNDESSSHSNTDFKSMSLTATPVKTMKKAQTLKGNVRHIKQESMENIPLASSRKNNGFLSIRPSHRTSSYSTSKLNLSVGPVLGASLPSQEYVGPKLFAKQKSKSNRTVIANAISYCCLAGSVNTTVKDNVLKDLNEADGNHFMILFRDSRCQYKSLYVFDFTTEELIFLSGNGPKKITHEMVEKFFKYNSGTKQFNAISSTKHLSTAVDAVCIQSSHWNTRPTGQILSSAQSTNSITQAKSSKR